MDDINNNLEGLEQRLTRRMNARFDLFRIHEAMTFLLVVYSTWNGIAHIQNSRRDPQLSPLVPLVHAANRTGTLVIFM